MTDTSSAARLRAINASLPFPPLACVMVFGCQQNEADGERLRGLLASLGYGMTADHREADVVLLNTCAVRDHAEKRVLGILGAMKKTLKPGSLLGVCGCMPQQERVQKKLKASYPQVDFTFGPSSPGLLPELILKRMEGGPRTFALSAPDSQYPEDAPALRADSTRAWVTIMQGCDNFCSYCIVPYVRGRERSRTPDDILRECAELAAMGYTELFLLGQNVNSYRPEGEKTDFPALLERINAIPGDFSIRFMTSHPKDAGERLFETMARCEKVAKMLHLPLQSGSDNVLRAMNRGYTRAEYLDKAAAARRAMPGLNLTSDIIVGFPGETDEDFEETLEMLKTVRFNQLFTFIYSPRAGTEAAKMPSDIPEAVVKDRFARLLETQKEIERGLDAETDESTQLDEKSKKPRGEDPWDR